MPSSIDDQVLDFYERLFEHLFSRPFGERISERRRLNPVIRQVEESAEAASSSLTRFFTNRQLKPPTVETILSGFTKMGESLQLEDIANPNVPIEETVDRLLESHPCPETVNQTHDAIYRLALYTVVQVLMLVGPVMAEWQKLNFSSTFELPRRVVNRLNEISEQINVQGSSAKGGADERYELLYRDYLLQRFHRVEAGTVRMTTNLDVDLRELFVMPRIAIRRGLAEISEERANLSARLMDLGAARRLYGWEGNLQSEEASPKKSFKKAKKAPTALEQVQRYSRNVIVGLPGTGKSTFFEWLQVQLASVEVKLVLAGQQAIPVLLRVRELDLQKLPAGSALIEKATASKERAKLMPKGWFDRMMEAGRVFFMLDGLDEAEPEPRDKYLIPWLLDLLQRFPKCPYLISSRPVGYPSGLLGKQKFAECDLLDFDTSQMKTYAQHWCTAVRLARNESDSEARKEGKQEGDKIIESFHNHPYIRDLARNPLMLSAICLVNYFEGGSLPDDRALLYKLCVEGLLHHWDQRRGIRSEFGFEEKMRVCRELALVMQVENLAECDADAVRATFTKVLNDADRAAKLLEHIRYRTGLLLERRPNVFGFAHLTFQEYLAARAIHEGNRVDITPEQLVREHDDGRWKEVIALFCGLATTPAKIAVIEGLIGQPDTESLSEVLTEAYFTSGSELSQERDLRRRVIERVAIAPHSSESSRTLNRFPDEEIAPIANINVGTIDSDISTSEAYGWLLRHSSFLNTENLIKKISNWQAMNPIQITEIFYLLHRFGSDEILFKISRQKDLYESKGPSFNRDDMEFYKYQNEIAIAGLSDRDLTRLPPRKGFANTFSLTLQNSLRLKCNGIFTEYHLKELLEITPSDIMLHFNNKTKKELILSIKRYLEYSNIEAIEDENKNTEDHIIIITYLSEWLHILEI